MIYTYIYIFPIFAMGKCPFATLQPPSVFRKKNRQVRETVVKLCEAIGSSRSCSCTRNPYTKDHISYTYIIFVYLIYIYLQLYIIYILIDTQSTILYFMAYICIFKEADVSYTGCLMLVNIDSYRCIYIYIYAPYIHIP